jgi:hypothetical protein
MVGCTGACLDSNSRLVESSTGTCSGGTSSSGSAYTWPIGENEPYMSEGHYGAMHGVQRAILCMNMSLLPILIHKVYFTKLPPRLSNYLQLTYTLGIFIT